MNLKLKYALIFNLFIAGILLISCLSIFFLYKNYKEADFNQRLLSESNTLYSELNLISLTDSLYLDVAYKLNSNNLSEEKVVIVNSAGQLVFKLPTNYKPEFLNNDTLLKIIKRKKLYFLKLGVIETVAQYSEENNTYIFVSAIDKVGFKKQQNLLYILIFVFCTALLVFIIITFFFIQQAFKPLVKLSNQIDATTAQNLTKKVDEGKGKSEINMIARNFNALLSRLNNAFETQKTFVQNASHELRTPLATMLSQTEAALNRNLDIEGYKKVLNSLKEDQTNLIELTNSLLLISQYDKINAPNTWPSIRIDELLYETVATCNRMFEDIQISLNFETIPDSESDLLVLANDTLLKSALRNLIKNAYIYSSDKKVTIVIKTIEPHIKITIINNGTQITLSEIDKIKIPFFRGKNASSKKGYGLGLSIVNKIIELHKGVLHYEAVNQNENHFIIIIPIA